MISSPPDIIMILGIALLVFGPKRLPELGKALGQGIGNFKKSMVDAEKSLQVNVETTSVSPISNSSEPASSINAASSDQPKT